MTVLDTSVLIDFERRDAQALDLVDELLAAGELAVSSVTVHEVLRSPALTPAWRSYWEDFFDVVVILDLDRPAAEAGAALWLEQRARNLKPEVGDVLIAGAAAAAGFEAVTADEGFAELAGARLLRAC